MTLDHWNKAMADLKAAESKMYSAFMVPDHIPLAVQHAHHAIEEMMAMQREGELVS